MVSWYTTLKYELEILLLSENFSYKLPLFISQGGSPSPFDRIQATRQATRAVNWLTEKIGQSITDEGIRAVDIFTHYTN